MAHVAADARRVGLQPAGSDRPEQRRRPAHGLVARTHRGAPAGHAARPRRRDVHAESGRRHPGDRRGDRRPALGASPGGARGHRRIRLQQPLAEQPQPGDLRLVHHRHERGRPRLRPRRGDRPAGVGDRDSGLPGEPRHAELWPDRRRRQGDLGTKLHAGGRTRRLRDHRPRRADRRGAVAPAHDSGPRRAGRRDLGWGCRSRNGSTSAPGWCRATTRS